MPWQFLGQSDWVQRARNPFNNINGDGIQVDIINSIIQKMRQVGNISQDHGHTYYGHYFLQSQDGPIQPNSGQPIDRAAWFGFVRTDRWLRNYRRGHPSELIIAYRRHRTLRLDGPQFNDRFIEVDAHPNHLGYDNIPGLIAWIADFDETWDQDVWEQTFAEVGKVR